MGTDEVRRDEARTVTMVDGEPGAAAVTVTPSGGQHAGLIRALLRQTAEQRLLGLRRSAAFFDAARRV